MQVEHLLLLTRQLQCGFFIVVFAVFGFMIVRGFFFLFMGIVGVMIIMGFVRMGFALRWRSIMIMAVIVFGPGRKRQGCQ